MNFFVYKLEYRILLKMLVTAGIERIKIFLPLYSSGVQCSVFTSVQGFEALYLISIKSLCTSTKIQMKKQFRSTLLFLLLNFQSWKEGLVFVIALEISPSEKKTRYCWHITML